MTGIPIYYANEISSDIITYTRQNQSVENAGVAFVKRADERNKYFEKINNQ